MRDRCQFIQDEITLAFVDDFMNLPFSKETFWINKNGKRVSVVEGVPAAEYRHDAMFYLTH